MRVRDFRDLLPSGHMVSRMPAMVDWKAYNHATNSGDVVLRYVNVGGNPLDRSVVLHTAHVSLDAVSYAEVLMTPLDPTGIGQHGQLRFVFDPGQGPVIAGLADPEERTHIVLEDLVLGWEVWRFKDDHYNIRRALDEANPLTMRVYSGPQRYLEDILQGHEWHSFPLTLPGGRRGAAELLAVALCIGDGIARHAISGMMDDVEHVWREAAPAGVEPSPDLRAAWHDLRAKAFAADRPGFVAAAVPGAESDTYNPLVRSCVEMLRYVVLLAARRLAHSGVTTEGRATNIPSPDLGSSEPWMHDAAACDLRGILARAPLALRYVWRFPQALPHAVIDQLDSAGFLDRKALIRYAPKKHHPYGADGLIRREL